MISDIAYAPADGTSRGHLLDLYLPDSATATGGPVPLLIWSSGSAFLSDDGKAGASAVAPVLNAEGWAVAGVSVRSSGQAQFPSQIHDVKAAIRWLRANAAEHNVDPDRFVTMGNSSGGWIASMAALTGGVDELEGDLGTGADGSGLSGVSSRVQAAIDLYGPTDFFQMDDHMVDPTFTEFNTIAGTTDGHADPLSPESRLLGAPIAEVPDLAAAANPASYAKAGADLPPMLIVHGDADPLVPYHQSVLLYEALSGAGADATFVSVPGGVHSHPYLTDSSASVGRIVTSTRTSGPDLDLFRTDGPTWDAILAFCHYALARPS